MAIAFNEDKTKVPVGIKSIETYHTEIEIPEKGSYYQEYLTSHEHDVNKSIVTMMIPELNDTPFADNYYHYLGAGITSITKAFNDGLKIGFFVSDSGTNDQQYPLTVRVEFKVVEFYG